MKVIAIKDLWNDSQDELLVLAGTTGLVTGQERGDAHKPPVTIVSFADGNSTYCTADEIMEIYYNHRLHSFSI